MSRPHTKKSDAGLDKPDLPSPLPGVDRVTVLGPWQQYLEQGETVRLRFLGISSADGPTFASTPPEAVDDLPAGLSYVLAVAMHPALSPVRAPERTAVLADALGSTKLAGLLGVSKSQPTRWRKGEETPSPRNARELVDLDHIYARACLLWEPEVAADWLESPNGDLGGATPLDVLRTRGAAEVLIALDAAEQGGMG